MARSNAAKSRRPAMTFDEALDAMTAVAANRPDRLPWAALAACSMIGGHIGPDQALEVAEGR